MTLTRLSSDPHWKLILSWFQLNSLFSYQSEQKRGISASGVQFSHFMKEHFLRNIKILTQWNQLKFQQSSNQSLLWFLDWRLKFLLQLNSLQLGIEVIQFLKLGYYQLSPPVHSWSWVLLPRVKTEVYFLKIPLKRFKFLHHTLRLFRCCLKWIASDYWIGISISSFKLFIQSKLRGICSWNFNQRSF